MNAILLCAGFGTRMYPLTETQPKSLLSVAGKPVLDHLLEQLLRFPQLEGVHLVVNNKFYAHFIEWQERWTDQIHITLHNDGVDSNAHRLGTIGDLAFVLENGNLVNSPAIVAAGDNIFLFDLLPMWQEFHSSQKNLLLALKSPDPERLKKHGVVQFDARQRVLAFQEKPQNPKSEWFCPAMYCLTGECLEAVFKYRKTAQSQDAIGHMMSYLVDRKEFFAYPVDGQRLDIGSLEDYEKANQILASIRSEHS